MRIPEASPQRQRLEPGRAPDSKGLGSLAVVFAVSATLMVLAIFHFSKWWPA